MQKKKIITGVIAFFIFLFVGLFLYDLSAKSSRFYAQGLVFESKNDFSNAYYNFSKIPFTSKFYTIALYKRANCALQLNDKKTAKKYFKKFSKNVKDEMLVPYALFEIANLELEEGHNSRALNIYKKIQKKYKDSDFSHASNFKIGVIKEGDEADEYFEKYLAYAPLGRYSDVAIKNLEKSKNLKTSAKLQIARSLIQKENFTRAIYYLNQVPFDDSWYYFAKVYEKTDNLKMQNALLAGLSSLNQNTKLNDVQIKDAVFMASKILSKGFLDVVTLTKDNKNPAYIIALYNLAQNSNIHSAQKYYSEIYFKNQNHPLAASALDELILYAYISGNYNQAIKLGAISDKISDKGQYYLARSYFKTGKKSEAISIYKKILQQNIDSYYAYRANSILKNEKKPFSAKKQLIKTNAKINFPYKKSKNISLLVDMKDISALRDFKIEDEFVKSYIAYKMGRHAYSELCATNEIERYENKKDVAHGAWMLAYPIYYENYVNKYAKIYNLSPYLMLALIKEESHFDADAKSDAGAIGLVQILPQTAQFVLKDRYSKYALNQVEYNINAGFKYFLFVKNEFNGSDLLSVISYNAGHGSAKQWQRQLNVSDYDVFVETIPYLETKNYVKKVYSSYWNYLRIYEL